MKALDSRSVGGGVGGSRGLSSVPRSCEGERLTLPLLRTSLLGGLLVRTDLLDHRIAS